MKAYPTIAAAATAFGIHNMTLERFMRGQGTMSGDAVASIIERTGLRFEKLFEAKDT